MIYLLFSSDYEVFLGGNFISEEKVLIEPTYILLDIVEKLEIPITLFCDVACIWRYRELGNEYFPNCIEKQLKEAIIRGNDIQAHIHPHWKNTKIEKRKYIFNSEEYYLGNISEEYVKAYYKIISLLKEAKRYLESLLRPIKQNYECIAFRAGGYRLQPREELIIKALINAGYLIDSSIIPNMKTLYIDYRKIVKLANYFLHWEKGLIQAADNGIFEIPIPSGYLKVIDIIKHLLFKFRLKIKYWKDGKEPIIRGYIFKEEYSEKKENKALFYIIKVINTITRRWRYLEIEEDPKVLFEISRNYIEKNKFLKKDIFFAVSMHPKTMDFIQYKCLEEYLKKMRQYYKEEIKAITFLEAKRILNLGIK